MKKILNNYRFIFTGLLVMVCLLTAKSAFATWTTVTHTETYQVVTGDPITVSLIGTTPITLPSHTTTLSWSTTNLPDSCDATINGMWGGSKSPNGGSEQIPDLYNVGTYAYEIICHKTGFADASSVAYVEVLPANGVTVDLTSDVYTLPYGGGSAILTWVSSGATSCNATSNNFNTGGSTNSNDTVNPTISTLYTITCDDGGSNSASDQVYITVLPQDPGGITVRISANPTSMTLPRGDYTTLTWVTTGTPDSCVASNSWSGNKNVNGGTENMTGLTAGTYIYTITCMKTGFATDVSQVSVTVLPETCTGLVGGGKDAGGAAIGGGAAIDGGAPPVDERDGGGAPPADGGGATGSCLTASLFANPSVLPYGGGNSTLTWSSLPNGVMCDSREFDTQGNLPNGSTGVNITSTTTYNVSCQDAGGNTASAVATITVLDNQVIPGQCLDNTHWQCVSPEPSIHRTGGLIGPWTWECPGSNGGRPASCSESVPIYQCNNGSDDDGDGLIDILDPGCHTDGNAANDFSYERTDPTEGDAVTQCSDGIDNDRDEKIDFGGKNGDPGCSSAQDNSENNNPKPKQIEI